MTIENSSEASNLLTEQQLWEAFTSHGWELAHGSGLIIERFKPSELMHYGGEYGHTYALANYVTEVMDEAADKSEAYDEVITDLEDYLNGMKRISALYEQVKDNLLVEDRQGEARYLTPQEAFRNAS